MSQAELTGAVAELDRQVQRGSMFTQAVLQRGTLRLDRAELLLDGLLQVLAAKGVVSPEELDAAFEASGDDDIASPDEDQPRPGAVTWPAIAVRVDDDADAAEPSAAVDCAARMHVCQAVCCRLRFALSAEEVEAGRVKWDIGHPYVIRHDARGTCVHNDANSHGCDVYADRPTVCRSYDCTHDGRIWKDFDAMVLNEEWIAEHAGARDIAMDAVLPSMEMPISMGATRR